MACVSATVTSFKEIPLGELQGQEEFRKLAETERIQETFDAGDGQPAKNCLKRDNTTYGSLNQPEAGNEVSCTGY